MKKHYNIFRLYIVHVETNDSIHHLICSYNRYTDIYTDIFTKSKIRVPDEAAVEPLYIYYPVLGVANYTTGEPLMLSKEDLLKKYKDLNEETETISQNKTMAAELLEKATLNFFPKEGVWYAGCFSRPEDLDMHNLPCHLRDDLWLAKMLKQNQKLYFLSTNKVLEFVKTSKLFQEKRKEYEQEIVRWQISYMQHGGEGWLASKEYGEEFITFSPNIDIGFRKGIVDTLMAIGMNKDAIEEGIEKNAPKWRNALMERAFENEYESVFLSIYNYDLPPVVPEFKANWLKLRIYEYYQRHKDYVDKYGVVEPDMLLSNDEVLKLKTYLVQKDIERKSEIEKSKSTVQKRVLYKFTFE